MIQGEEIFPPKPYNARTETNAEVLRQLTRDLSSIDDLELTALDGYRVFRHSGDIQPSWGYCLESARVEGSDANFILFRQDKSRLHVGKVLDWVPLSNCYTAREAFNYNVAYAGPSEEVLRLILELFRDVFEFALKANWSYERRIEFYYSVPFEELSTIRSMKAFRRTLFSKPPFDGFEWTFPGIEEIQDQQP